LTEKFYPIFVGDMLERSVSNSDSVAMLAFESYFKRNSFLKSFPASIDNNLIISSVESKLDGHLSRMTLGSAMLPEQPVQELLNKMGKSQGHVVQSTLLNAFETVKNDILKMLKPEDGLQTVEEDVEVQPVKKKMTIVTAGTVVRSLFNNPRPEIAITTLGTLKK
jgi:hypothetical protein